MSDAGTMATGAPNKTWDAGPKLYGVSGEPLHSGSRSSPDKIDPLAGFVKRRPFTSEPVALVIGYLLGNIT